jgi:hypothetical protein
MVPLVFDPLGCGVVRVKPSCTTASQTPHELLNSLVSGSPKPQRQTLPKLVELSMKGASSGPGEVAVRLRAGGSGPHGPALPGVYGCVDARGVDGPLGAGVAGLR